ncbi:MAG: hypothetical protein KDH91_07740, partial [Rhodoferax sp.]|nr:hypothetical protein [Rhodoferax sp.]
MARRTALLLPLLTRQFPRAGRLDAILLRPARRAPMQAVPQAQLLQGRGLLGDRTADGTAP